MKPNEIKEMQNIKLKIFMFDYKDMPIKLTKAEQVLLGLGKKTLTDMDREQLLMSLNVKDHITVSNEVKDCCLISLCSGVASSKIGSPYERYISKKPDTGVVIESILETNYSYIQLLKKIRKKIITVDEPVNYNSKI